MVKVLSGMRGSGKTTLLALFSDWLRNGGADDDRIVYINMEAPENDSLLNYQGLYGYIRKRLCAGRFTYVLIDEVQRCPGYENAIQSLLIRGHIDLYVAGSNAPFFSDVPYVEIRVLPLSFAEYLLFSRARVPGKEEELKEFSVPIPAPGGTGAPDRPAVPVPPRQAFPVRTDRRLPRRKEQAERLIRQEAFNNYLSFGGLPFAAALGGDAGLIRQCVEGIYNTALIRDVAGQPGIGDIPLLEHVARTLSRSTGRPAGAKNIAALIGAALIGATAIGAKGRKISSGTAETYMKALVAAFVFFHAGRFDIKTGKHLKTPGKYYVTDTGVRNLLLEPSPPDLTGQVENVVCLELLRRGSWVCTGRHGGDEISFVAFTESPDEGGGRAYFQITDTLRDADAIERKISALQRIPGDHPRYLISLDETPSRPDAGGVIRLNLLDWLLA
uniref:ATPase n=1 Tax=uncultured bacterium contig00088 TaxID=1181561 RepID=A0A806KL85_9BACT|nr:hypothetical protein [uncultured bacterium contig00088]